MEYLQENVYIPSGTLESIQNVVLPQFEKAKQEIKGKIKASLKDKEKEIYNYPKNKIECNNIKNEEESKR
jgi:hypothetical protein